MAFAQGLNRFLFDPPIKSPALGRRLATITFGLFLYVLGVAQWHNFLDFQNMSYHVGDWPYIHMRHSVLQESVRSFQIPFYVDPPDRANEYFLKWPFLPLSPQLFALRFLSIPSYFSFNLILLYSMGFHGCLLLRRKFQLSPFVFAVLFTLFNFNGYLTSHLAIGHFPWVGCFLLPYYFYLILDIRKDRFPAKTLLLLAMTLFGMLLQGDTHTYLICHAFLSFIILSNVSAQTLTRFAQLCGLSLLMGTCRFVPAALFMGDQPRPYASGYPSVVALFERLTMLNDSRTSDGTFSRIGTLHYPEWSELGREWAQAVSPWEYDVYIGIGGFAFLALCGVWLRFRRQGGAEMPLFKNLDWAIVLMTLLTLDANYFFVSLTKIPLLSTIERAPARFIILPLLAVIIISCIRLQVVLNTRSSGTTIRIIGVVVLLHNTFLLWLHSHVYRSSLLDLLYLERGKDAIIVASLVQGDNRFYEHVIVASFVVSAASLLFWLYLWRRVSDDTRATLGRSGKEA